MSHAPLTILTAVLFLGLSAPSAPLEGAGIEWDTLNEEILKLLGTGKYDRGVIVAKQALSVAESNVGPDHPDVATSLIHLATLYADQGKYESAEPLFKRSLTIREKALGPDHPDVAEILYNLAELYHDQGKYAAAEPLYKRSLAIYEKALGPDHPDLATSLHNLGFLA